MAKIRSSVALGLMIVDFIGTITLFSLIMSCISDIDHQHRYDYRSSYLRKLSQMDNLHANLRGTKLKLIELKKLIEKKKSKNIKVFNPLDFNEEEFILPQQKQLISSENLRKLDTNSDFEFESYLIIVSLVSIFFTFVLMVSFCIDKNECCTSDTREELGIGCCIYCLCCDDCENRNRSSNCNCEGGNGNGNGLIVLLLIVIIFILIYFVIKACGKHVSRYISISIEFLTNLGIFVLILMYQAEEKSNYFPVILTLSGILALANFLGLLLPNLSCCLTLTYGYRPGNIEPILNQTTDTSQKYKEPIQKTEIIPPPKPNTSDIKTEVPYYPPQVPNAYPQNNPSYQPQPSPIYPQPSNFNSYYNSGQGSIYDVSPGNYQNNPQPPTIYDAQLPSQQEIYSKPQ